MAFVHLGGDESTAPTYFEVVAADRLVPSLKAAVMYALSVFSQRHPWVHRLLNYEDEVFVLLALALDAHSLLATDSTFADSLYGLKLRPLGPPRGGSGSGDAAGARARLSRRQRWLVLACEVLLPYLRAKLDKAYQRSAAPGGVLGLAIRYGAAQGSPGAAAAEARTAGGGGGGGSGRGTGAALQQRAHRALAAAYPWLHAGIEGLTFGYHLAFLLGASRVHSPVLHALAVCIARISSQDLMAAERSKQARRQALLSRMLGPASATAAAAAAAAASTPVAAARPAASAAGAAARGAAAGGAPPHARSLGAAAAAAAARAWAVRSLLGAGWLAADHARSALVLAVFGFKALEWWYTSGEERLAAGKALPPPPPPPPPRVVPPPAGCGLPPDPAHCPLCRKRTTNPAAVATSGFVFCYPCAFGYVMQHGRCPVSHLPATLDHVRKLYEAS